MRDGYITGFTFYPKLVFVNDKTQTLRKSASDVAADEERGNTKGQCLPSEQETSPPPCLTVNRLLYNLSGSWSVCFIRTGTAVTVSKSY